MGKRYISIGSDSTEYIQIGDWLNDKFTSLDLSTFDKIEVRLQYQNKINEIATYSTEDVLVRYDDSDGLLEFYLKRAVTLELKPNKDIYAIVSLYTTDTNFEDNIKKVTLQQSYLFTTGEDSSYDN